MHESDRADAGRASRDAVHETDGSAETVSRELRPPQSADCFQTTERDGSPPRVPDGLSSTFEDGTLLDMPGTSQCDHVRYPEPEVWEGGRPAHSGVRGSRRAGPGRDGGRVPGATGAPQSTRVLKMILTERSHDPAAVARFLHQPQAVARLRHPNIVEIYSIGHFPGHPYLELEYVDGEPRFEARWDRTAGRRCCGNGAGTRASHRRGAPRGDRPSRPQTV